MRDPVKIRTTTRRYAAQPAIHARTVTPIVHERQNRIPPCSEEDQCSLLHDQRERAGNRKGRQVGTAKRYHTASTRVMSYSVAQISSIPKIPCNTPARRTERSGIPAVTERPASRHKGIQQQRYVEPHGKQERAGTSTAVRYRKRSSE